MPVDVPSEVDSAAIEAVTDTEIAPTGPVNASNSPEADNDGTEESDEQSNDEWNGSVTDEPSVLSESQTGSDAPAQSEAVPDDEPVETADTHLPDPGMYYFLCMSVSFCQLYCLHCSTGFCGCCGEVAGDDGNCTAVHLKLSWRPLIGRSA